MTTVSISWIIGKYDTYFLDYQLLKIGKAIHISSIFLSGGWAKLKFIYLWYLIGKLWTFTGLRWWYCCQNTSLKSESTRKHYIIKVTHESALQSRHWIPRVIIKQIKVNIKLMFWKSQGIIASYVGAWPCLFYRPAMWVASLGTGKLWLVSQNDCHKDRIKVRMNNTFQPTSKKEEGLTSSVFLGLLPLNFRLDEPITMILFLFEG